MSQQPDDDVKRRILQNKLAQYRAKAYDYEVTATVSGRMGLEGDEQQARQESRKFYKAAQETQALLDELPEEPDSEDETEPED